MTNRKARKTDHGVKDFDELLEAIKSIKIEPKVSIRKAAASIGIPYQNLSRYVKKFENEVSDNGVPSQTMKMNVTHVVVKRTQRNVTYAWATVAKKWFINIVSL